METIKCLIVDDEELARTLLSTYVDRVDFLELVASVESPMEALTLIKKERVDLLFLDIQMPEIKGTDFSRLLPENLQVIFTTAYSEYALEGFELNALDYLLKPITFERFLAAVDKARPNVMNTLTTDSITVKSGYDLHKLKYDDILYIESDGEYVVYHTSDGKIMSNQSLTKLDQQLPNDLFMRVHRSFIVNKKKAKALKGRDLIIGTTAIPVSDSYFDDVRKKLFQ